MNGRAPKGGKTIAGIFYRGGQFLPSNDEPKRGMFNRNKSKAAEHRTIARLYIKSAIKSYFKNDKGSSGNALTMAEVSIRRANYWESK